MKLLILLLSTLPLASFARLQIATTTSDLSALVKVVGATQLDVFSIAKGTHEPHQIEAKPSYMVKLRTADLVFAQGLELESAWLGPLIQGSRNSKWVGKNAVYELGPELSPIEVSKKIVSRADGDVHPGGNPHFQLDPIRLGQAAVLIAQRLSNLDTEQADFFNKNASEFQKKMSELTKKWQERIKKTGIKNVVTYHKTFSYFCERFQIQCDTQLEPKPGIPPTASHLLDVIEKMKRQNIKFVMIENLFEDSVGAKLSNGVPGVKIKRLPVSVDGDSKSKTNEELIESIVKSFEEAAQ